MRLPQLCPSGDSTMSASISRRFAGVLIVALPIALAGCTPLGSLMSPYSEKFSCKNDDHGQCIHPERAYEDAVAGVASRSDPAATNDRAMLGPGRSTERRPAAQGAYGSYRDSVYRELRGLIEAPVTPMLRPARTVRTLILPYADRQRPERLYMPRYVYSILDRPEWVVGSSLTPNPAAVPAAPILGQSAGDETAPIDRPGLERKP